MKDKEKAKKPTHVISADVYDALELVALSLGGVGQGRWFGDRPLVGSSFLRVMDFDCPICINGMGQFLRLTKAQSPMTIKKIGISTAQNDDAVQALTKAGHAVADDRGVFRVPFAKYVRHLNIVRGAR